MQDGKTVAQQALQGLKTPPSSGSPTEAGRTVSEPEHDYHAQSRHAQSDGPDRVDAINRVFAELELAYHNQYRKAFPSDASLQMAKQLWFDALRSFSPAVILKACRSAIAHSEYLPSLHTLNKECTAQLSSYGLPDALTAYREACNAPSPKRNAIWSHLAVYYAGKDCGWFQLASETEDRMLPNFERHYEKLCERVLAGERLESPEQARLESETHSNPLSADEKHQRMAQLRSELKL